MLSLVELIKRYKGIEIMVYELFFLQITLPNFANLRLAWGGLRGYLGCAGGWVSFSWLVASTLGSHFLIFGVRQVVIFTVSKRIRMFVLQVKNKVFFIHYKVHT